MLISACCPEFISAISVSAILSKSSEEREVVVGAGASVLVGASKETDLQQAGKEGPSKTGRWRKLKIIVVDGDDDEVFA